MLINEEMQMPLEPEQKIKGEFQNTVLTIKKKLGEGTQGEVYLVTNDTMEMACKWYKPSQATDEQKAAIRSLVRSGPPRGVAGARFIWPLDLVTASNLPQFEHSFFMLSTPSKPHRFYSWCNHYYFLYTIY
jgi:DNA-binding helix-hairpin-helix protein with protein kinase domain